jgi:hypothetical protein
MGGIMDVAINSLDGNRDTFAQGPVSYYNENDLYGLCASGTNKNRQCSDTDKETTCGTAINCNGAKTLTQAQGSRDNYMWSFFINDQLDLTSPKITLTDPVTTKPDCNTTTNICTYSMADDLVNSIHTHFNKLMMSARLTTGSVTVDNGNGKIVHQLLNLKTYAQEPLAYWVTNKGFDIDPKDGEYEESDVYINHSDFSKASLYRAQAGSGLKDVYQNCYLPSASDDCAATLIGNPAQPSCCNGQATAGTSCPK